MQKDYEMILENFGIEEQLRHFNQEVYELNRAIIEYDCEEYKYYDQIEKEHKEHIEEEVADVLNFIEQFIIYYKLDKSKIKSNQKFKNERTIYEMINKIDKKDRNKHL